MTTEELIWMHSKCEHGIPLSESCDDCDEIQYAAVEADLMESARNISAARIERLSQSDVLVV